VYLGPESNSWINATDDRFTLAGKQGWDAQSSDPFQLESGRTYMLSFNSLAPYYTDNGVQKVDDRTTFLDNISLRSQAVPLPGTLAILVAGAGGFLLGAGRRRRRMEASSGR
jgi:hypothetical protein